MWRSPISSIRPFIFASETTPVAPTHAVNRITTAKDSNSLLRTDSRSNHFIDFSSRRAGRR